MSDSKNFVLQVDNNDFTQDQLVFQDIPHSRNPAAVTSPEESDGKHIQTHTFMNFPNPNDSEEEDKADLLEGKKKKQPSFWTFEYYQMFFDVDSRQVLRRILCSVFPNPNANYLQTSIRPNPDLYGPFWICITLIFSTAIAGNLANYLSIHNANTTQTWKYDFHKVTFAAVTIFAYWWLMPTLLYALLWWRGNKAGYTFTEIICIYGYSLAIYIPISFLWVIPLPWLQWLLVMLGMFLSGTVLVLTLWPSIKHDKKQISVAAMVVIMLMHGLLAVGFMLYFFHVSSVDDEVDEMLSTAMMSRNKFSSSISNNSTTSSLTTKRLTTLPLKFP